MIKQTISVGLFALIAACGPLAKDTGSQRIAQLVTSLVPIGKPEAATAAVAPATMTREQVDASPVPLMLMAVPSRGGGGLVQMVGQNDGRATWQSADGISITTENGVVVATRGLGDDLYSASVSSGPAYFTDGGTGPRVHEYLTGEDRIARPELNCTVALSGEETLTILDVTYETSRYNERCINDQFDFTNVIWVGSDGKIRQSQQWISMSVGYLVTQQL